MRIGNQIIDTFTERRLRELCLKYGMNIETLMMYRDASEAPLAAMDWEAIEAVLYHLDSHNPFGAGPAIGVPYEDCTDERCPVRLHHARQKATP